MRGKNKGEENLTWFIYNENSFRSRSGKLNKTSVMWKNVCKNKNMVFFSVPFFIFMLNMIEYTYKWMKPRLINQKIMEKKWLEVQLVILLEFTKIS